MSLPNEIIPVGLLGTGTSSASEAYQISRSVRLNSADSAYFSRTPSVSGNRKTWTWAGWVKRSGTTTGWLPLFQAYDGSSRAEANFLQLSIYSDQIGLATDTVWLRRSQAVYRDYSAWYHIVCAFDTTQATAANRVKLYVNGIEITAYAASSDPTLNSYYGVNRAVAHQIGQRYGGQYFPGYLADIHFIDGQALTPSSFGEFDANGIWQPIDASGLTYGTNGFHLPFSDNSTAAALGTDTSGNSNTWTVNNISVTAGSGNDSLVDSPTNITTDTDTGAGGEVRGNYCTWNPLAINGVTLSNGNLDYTSSSAGWGQVKSTIGMSTDKWYFETTINSNSVHRIGVTARENYDLVALNATNYTSSNGVLYKDGSTFTTGATYTTGDVIGVAFDASIGSVTYYKNGALQGTVTGMTTGLTYFAAIDAFSTSTSGSINFGQRPFAYTAPSGYKALCTTNLDTPTGVVAQPNTAFDVITATGTAADRTFTMPGGFGPDLVWSKSRSNPYNNALFDTIRGGTKRLISNLTNAEDTQSNMVKSFTSDGFVQGSDIPNTSGESGVYWCWDAGETTDPANTDGSITSSVRANPSAGFSIVSWVGTYTLNDSVGHGLNAAPKLIITKNRDSSVNSWRVFTTAVDGSVDRLFLDSTSAIADVTGLNSPTSSVFYVEARNDHNALGDNIIAYCFAPVDGFSSMGSYLGNGSSDGPFIYTGFRPRWVMLKSSSNGGTGWDWHIFDAARNTFNAMNNFLDPNAAKAENTRSDDATYTDMYVDFVSNGFKLRNSYSSPNHPGATFVFAAFAEAPFALARAR